MRPLALAVLALAACRGGQVTVTEGSLRVGATELDFGTVFVGRSRTLTVEVSNSARAPQGLRLEVDLPFSAPPELEVPGAATLAVELVFTPREAVAVESRLRLLSMGEPVEVVLRGRGAPLPSCPAEPCRVSAPDDQGMCQSSPGPDGTACAQPCIVGGVCERGTCVGAARPCDDGDACTSDRCDALSGCVFEPLRCADALDACHVGSCDSRKGCTVTEVPDGVACGANDCVRAHVCIAGTCRQVSAPDGSQCANASGCQPAGVCRDGVCERPPPVPLTPAWTLSAPTHTQTIFTGTADALGNLYWFTTRSGNSTLVSVDRDGRPRFTVPLTGAPLSTSESSLFVVSDGLLAVLMRDGAIGVRLELRATADGRLQWAKQRAELLAVTGLGTTDPLWIVSGGSMGVPSRVWLNLRTNAGGSAWRSWIAAFDAQSGALEWTFPGTYFERAIADDDGVYVHDALFVQTLFSVSPTGTERWRHTSTAGSTSLAGAFGGAVLTVYPAALRDGASGTISAPLDAGVFIGPTALMGEQGVLAMDPSAICRRWFGVPGAGCVSGVVLLSTRPVSERAGADEQRHGAGGGDRLAPRWGRGVRARHRWRRSQPMPAAHPRRGARGALEEPVDRQRRPGRRLGVRRGRAGASAAWVERHLRLSGSRQPACAVIGACRDVNG